MPRTGHSGLDPEPHVLGHGVGVEELRLLERASHSSTGPAGGAASRDVLCADRSLEPCQAGSNNWWRSVVVHGFRPYRRWREAGPIVGTRVLTG